MDAARVVIPATTTPDPTTPAEGVHTRIENADGKAIDRVQVTTGERKTADPNRPAYLPEKFKAGEDLRNAVIELAAKQGMSEAQIKLLKKATPDEDLASLYADMEKKQGSESGKKEEPAKPEDKKDEQPKDAQGLADETSKTLEEKGLSYDDMRNEFINKGELSAETYAKLEKGGWSKSFVDAHVRGLQAVMAQQIETLAKDMGGVENYDAMQSWAKSNMTKGEADAYNRIMDSGNMESMKLAARALWSKYEAAEGREPNLLGGDRRSSNSDGIKPFKSMHEVKEAMKDKRYGKDPAYERELDARLAISDI